MVDIEEIMELISLKQEGAYWDFKRNWYEDGHQGDMLHDIINMANNLVNRDAYIIIGVDEENDYQPYDLGNDTNRRSTQNMVDFLRDKKFAGDFRPVVSVEHCIGYGYTLDIIVIHNSTNTPFYLKSKFQKVSPFNIYVRIQDTNTPVNGSADIQHVEYLWRKRLGMIQSPLEKMQLYLSRKSDWDKSPVFEECYYYRWAPEYTIGYMLDDPYNRDGYEFYFLNQTDNTPHWTVIQLKYHQTLLKEISGIMLDGGRHFTPCPQCDGVDFNDFGKWDISYRYWVEDSLEYAIHLFYVDENDSEAMYSELKLMENILVFDNEVEHQLFNEYIKKNWVKKEITQAEKDALFIQDVPKQSIDRFKEQIINTQILKKMLTEFRTIRIRGFYERK